LGVDRDGETMVQNFGGGFYVVGYLNQSNFNYNKFS
jgi:hypothetical protein